MLFTIKDNTLKIDMGDHYYTGQITQELFPEEIRDNFMDILQKSFVDFTDDDYSVTNNFDDKNIYVINFSYKAKPFSFKRKIDIPVTKHDKDFKDYTNERIEKLELMINVLFEEVKQLKETKNLISDEKEDESEKKEYEEDSEDEEDSDVENVQIMTKTKGGKKVPAVVQMKNGRQVVKK